MPYRDPAQRAAWMREYRKRKHAVHMSEPLERIPPASIEGARDPWPPIIRKPAPQTKAPDGRLGGGVQSAQLKRLWTLRGPSPSGSSLRRCTYIATTLATVHPAHGVAIVEAVKGATEGNKKPSSTEMMIPDYSQAQSLDRSFCLVVANCKVNRD